MKIKFYLSSCVSPLRQEKYVAQLSGFGLTPVSPGWQIPAAIDTPTRQANRINPKKNIHIGANPAFYVKIIGITFHFYFQLFRSVSSFS